MNGGTIVCGVDGSPDSYAALRVAHALAARLESRLVLAYVAEPTQVPYSYAGSFGGMHMTGPQLAAGERERLREYGEALLEQMSERTSTSEADHRVEVGEPAARLASIADEEDAGLIVVGSRGRGAFKAAFLGSVSNSLVGDAHCPVLIVPPGAVEVREPRAIARQPEVTA